MSDDASSVTRRVHPRGCGAPMDGEDQLVVEEPLAIRSGDTPLAVTMRTPGHDEELAAGFLFTEGIVEGADEIESLQPCAEAGWGNVIEARLPTAAAAAAEGARRASFLSSSCGICGKESIDQVRQRVAPLADTLRLTQAVLLGLPERMRALQAGFARTGGLHAAALFDETGSLLCLREDVGRHNAVDKVIGHELLLGRLPLAGRGLLVSGRLSFEITQKAARAGIELLAGVSAPSSLAVDLAGEVGMTLVGFLRAPRFNIYTATSRIEGDAGQPG